jgi:glycosyltransferase involved in cell wall biosynthesis
MTTTTVDCRWLGYSGVGRVTELFLAGLSEVRPPGRWRLWGPEPTAAFAAAAGAEHVLSRSSPLSRFGQAGRRELPDADRFLFLHTVRPLGHGRQSVVLVHDTIPVRFAEPPWRRPFQRAFYACSAHQAGGVIVYSDATAANCVTDLWLSRERVRRIRLTTDVHTAARARAARSGPGTHLLYVGLDRPQKNLDRAVAGYSRSAFAARGGTFVLVGIQSDRLTRVRRLALASDRGAIDVRGRCSDDDLVELYAGAAALIVPSLEEGFGLPVIEGIAAGVPVCAANTAALVEAGRGIPELFDPRDEGSIAAAIDRVVAMGADGTWAGRSAAFALQDLPTAADVATDILAALDELPS